MAYVQGLTDLKRKLARVPKQAALRMREALEKGAKEINDAQKSLAQRSKRSGDLIDGITYREGDHELQLEIVSEVFYSKHVEFGTQKVAAQPFFYPGYRLSKKRVKRRVERAVKRAAKEAVSVG